MLKAKIKISLKIMQNNCLCIIAKAYQRTLTFFLKTEIYILFIDIQLNSLMARAIQCLKDTEMNRIIKQTYSKIRQRLMY